MRKRRQDKTKPINEPEIREPQDEPETPECNEEVIRLRRERRAKKAARKEASLAGVQCAARRIERFTQIFSQLTLREYQKEAIERIAQSVVKQEGDAFVVMFPRQSGKNELQAQLEAYLLAVHSCQPVEIVKVSPTFRPQSLNAMRRLERILTQNYLVNLFKWKKKHGYVYRVGEASIYFLSGAAGANVVGATASLLLECDEAQDVLPAKWDRDFAPMAASTNATRVFWGTAWTADTLLARELRRAQEAEAHDGARRAFVLTAEQVGAEVPAYRQFVCGEVQKFGRTHPLVQTQYFSEEIDAENRMFSERRLALIRGDHPRRYEPQPGVEYALLLDVAGEDEAITGRAETLEAKMEGPLGGLSNPRRDATALTVVAVDLCTLADPGLQAPTYRVVDRREWVGESQRTLYEQVRALGLHWAARRVVVDATGIGAGLASFLEKALPGRVTPFIFTASTKSELGWKFLAMIDSGRFKDYAVPPAARDAEQDSFVCQARLCQLEITAGPERRMKWSVPASARDPHTGHPAHDDWIISAALCAVLDREAWNLAAPPLVIRRGDPLDEMHGY